MLSDAVTLGRSLLTGGPFHLIVFVTSQCNHTCPDCLVEGLGDRGQLALADLERLASSLSHLPYLSITGGEPFLRQDLAQVIAAFYRHSGLRRATLHTNGSMPDRTLSAIDELRKECPALQVKLAVSLDGLAPSQVRRHQHEKAFALAVETLRRARDMQDERLSVFANTLVSEQTLPGIPALKRFVREELRVEHSFTLVRGSRPASRALSQAYQALTDVEARSERHGGFLDVIQFFDAARYRRIRGLLADDGLRMRCYAGRRTLVVSPAGNVLGCEPKPIALGDLRQVDFDLPRLMRSRSFREAYRRSFADPCRCTWECAIPTSLLFDVRGYPALAMEWLRWSLRSP